MILSTHAEAVTREGTRVKGRKWMTVLAALCVCMAVLPRADAEKKRALGFLSGIM